MYFIFVDDYAIDKNKKYFGLRKIKEIKKALLSKDCHLYGVIECNRIDLEMYLQALRCGNYDI